MNFVSYFLAPHICVLLVNPDDCPENMAWLTGMSLGISIQSITMLELLEMFMLVLYVEDHTLDMNFACPVSSCLANLIPGTQE